MVAKDSNSSRAVYIIIRYALIYIVPHKLFTFAKIMLNLKPDSEI